MAEFCFECYKKYLDKDAKIENLVMDDGIDLCEGCGEWKQTVLQLKNLSLFDRLRYFVEKIVER